VVAHLPSPSSVVQAFNHLVGNRGFWESAYLSSVRVMWGFIAAMVIGIPFGLLMAVSRTAKAICFPVFELLRPIPPLAWVPAAIIFWPTAELSITFVTFLGAFFTVVINTVGGAEQIDRRYVLAARSMGGQVNPLPPGAPPGHPSLDRHGRRGRYGNHLAGRRCRRDDLRRRTGSGHRRGRPRFPHLELLPRPRDSPGRRGNDLPR